MAYSHLVSFKGRGGGGEVDTQMILYFVPTDAEFLVVSCQDRYFFFLVSHLDKMSCKQLLMRAGTTKKPKYHVMLLIVILCNCFSLGVND